MANTVEYSNHKKKTVANFNIQIKIANKTLLLLAFYYLKRQKNLPIKFMEERNMSMCHGPERNTTISKKHSWGQCLPYSTEQTNLPKKPQPLQL